MANSDQLAILKKGTKAWNEWRPKNLRIAPNLTMTDLSGADLSGADLSGANLSGADLSEANLSGVDLREAGLTEANLRAVNLSAANLSGADIVGAHFSAANLSQADLSWANLLQADLRGANLKGANLHGTNLTSADLSGANLNMAKIGKADLGSARLHGANLSRADLSMANLNGADLREANLSEAKLSSTILVDVDLSEVKGLEMVRHTGPSEISISTIYKSKGKIPEVFLRGCGVPENMITFMHSLVGTAIEFYSCFISYSSEDESFAKRVHADLQSNRVRVWFAPEDLKIGDKFPTKIDEAIRVYDKLMLVLSVNSINSPWVRKEVRTALEKEEKEKRTVLFPIRLDDAFMDTTEDWADDIRRNRHVGDFKHWKDHDSYQKAFDRLLRDLKSSEAK